MYFVAVKEKSLTQQFNLFTHDPLSFSLTYPVITHAPVVGSNLPIVCPTTV